jgi:tRNA(Ile2) C34 agmatinyltransferase TiaS
MEPSEIERALLRKLYYYQYIGHRHTSETSALKGFPKHLRGEVRRALRRLIRLDLIWVYPSARERHVSLNSRRIEEIRRIIEED